MPYDRPMSNEKFESLIEKAPFASGGARDVFRVPSDANVVIKRRKGIALTNFIEWTIWSHVKDTDLAAIFGECVTISPDGAYLMMERLADLTTDDGEVELLVPDWMTDVTFRAFGKNATGQVKLRDYGLVNLAAPLSTHHRVRRRLTPARRQIRRI